MNREYNLLKESIKDLDRVISNKRMRRQSKIAKNIRLCLLARMGYLILKEAKR